MSSPKPEFELCLAASAADLRECQALRYQVFVEELGGDGPMVDHDAKLERDAFDAHFDHLMLRDHALPGAPVVGVYRVMRDDQMQAVGRFYSEDEYDLTPLLTSGRRLLELGRSCVRAEYRGGEALHRLWRGLTDYIDAHRIEVLFGVASFHGTDPQALAAPLSMLHHSHLAPLALRTHAHPAGFQRMDLLDEDAYDRRDVMRGLPPLIKAYLRLGGFVGQGAYIDRAFNTTDVCIIVDIDEVPPRVKAMYRRGRG
ncbi:MAG: ornithine-acyl-ACP acyltransferase [Rhodobacterales bacterium]|nr:MAG: ornithine-acyl-ACP acyltransferase [Rhodobacterales bacterium]